MYHFVFAGDEAYIKFISVVITSIVENIDTSLASAHFTNKYENKEEKFIFHILTDSFNKELPLKLKEFEDGLNTIFATHTHTHTHTHTI